MTPGSAEQIVGWSDDELLETVRENAGAGADADLPDDIRFIGGVVRLLAKRIAKQGGDNAPAVFFLLPSLPDGATAGTPTTNVPMLDNGLTAVGGRLWFVSPAVRYGVAVTVAEWSDETLFGCLGSHDTLGTVPAIIFETRTDEPEARYYPSGLAEPDTVRVLALGGKPIGLDEAFAVIDRLHETQLAAPSGLPPDASPWSKARSFRPHHDAEKRIQVIVKAALQGAFPSTTVRSEQSEAIGRLDLEIEEALPAKGEFVRHVLLELKVLRSFYETGSVVAKSTNTSAVRDGVTQAVTYRDERDAKASALCCFDMRKDATSDCFNGVKGLARQSNVRLRAWRLFPSAKAYREVKA